MQIQEGVRRVDKEHARVHQINPTPRHGKDHGRKVNRFKFLNRPLDQGEFRKKYWADGYAIYQYWTPDISDGTTEREQLIFNDLRALHDRMELDLKYAEDLHQEAWGKAVKAEKKAITAICIAAAAMTVTITLVIVCLLG